MRTVNSNTPEKRLRESYKRASKVANLVTRENTLRKQGAFDRGREWFRLEVK